MTPGPDPEHSIVEILEIFVISPDPAHVASEVGEKLETSTQGARNRLEQLVEDGYLDKKEPGSRTTIYWHTQTGHRYYSAEMSVSVVDNNSS